MKRIVCCVALFLMLSSSSYAVESKEVARQIIQKVYNRMIQEKERREILATFRESALKTDLDGWPFVEYSLKLTDKTRFYVLVRSLPIDQIVSKDKLQGYAEYEYPIAGIKFIVSVEGRSLLGRFDLAEEVRVISNQVYDFYQDELPLQLFIDLSNPEVRLGQKVEFDLVLKNAGGIMLKLKDINSASTYCLFNQSQWGSENPTGIEDLILQPGEEIRRKIIYKPKDKGSLEIFCSYGVAYNGLRPSARASVNVK